MPTTIGSSTSYPSSVPSLSETADVQVALRLLAYGTSTEPANDAAISVNSTFGRAIYRQQPAITAITASGTTILTGAQVLSQIITVTQTAAVTLTLPTVSLLNSSFQSTTAPVNTAFDWSVINLGTLSGAVTISVTGVTNHTYVGNATVAIGTSARFRTVKTATTPTFTTYRIS